MLKSRICSDLRKTSNFSSLDEHRRWSSQFRHCIKPTLALTITHFMFITYSFRLTSSFSLYRFQSATLILCWLSFCFLHHGQVEHSFHGQNYKCVNVLWSSKKPKYSQLTFYDSTVIGIVPMSIMIDAEHNCFLANHPFLIVIKDSNKMELFIGRVTNI